MRTQTLCAQGLTDGTINSRCRDKNKSLDTLEKRLNFFASRILHIIAYYNCYLVMNMFSKRTTYCAFHRLRSRRQASEFYGHMLIKKDLLFNTVLNI